MGTLYKITDKVWGISDLPWPAFYAIRGWVFLKIIIGALILCLVTVTFPLLYIFGIWYLIKKKKKPNWLYFALYTALMGWYIFCIVKFLILGYPIHTYSSWPTGDKPIFSYDIPKSQPQQNWSPGDDQTVSFDFSLIAYKTAPEKPSPYHYRLTIRDAEFEYDWLNRHRKQQNLEPVKLTSRQLRNLEGTYAWDSKINFATQAELLNYVCENFDEMQKFKESSKSDMGRNSYRKKSAEDEYNDRLDGYLDDPEDEIEYPPEIFDFQND